ncbi:MAG: RIP metalloprotease RseP [Bacteroidales bacterium]|nr:RIP metalloprotease RseP [Bacteroidales bacterium]
MTGLIMAAQLILGLSILVILHELGHFLAARAFGIRVEKFYLFFDAWGFKLISFKIGDTEYGIGWLPLGGYVKISGMIDESMDKEAMKQPPQPWEFRSKPAWQRLVVMLGGVTVNAILGVLVFAFVLLKYNQEYLPNESVSDGIYAYELGREIGFQSGDRILTVDGKSVERFSDILSTRVFFGSRIEVQRGDQTLAVDVPDDFYRSLKNTPGNRIISADNFPFVIDSVVPEMPAAEAGFRKGDVIVALDGERAASWGAFAEHVGRRKGMMMQAVVARGQDTMLLSVPVDSTGRIGVYASDAGYTLRSYTLGTAMRYGLKDAVDLMVANVKGFGKILSGKEKATESLQGPIGIAQIYGGEWLWSKFWFITGLLSLILAFMNILPIPALDGGHVIFLTLEVITRRKFSDAFMEKAQMVGMVLLLALMVFVIGNDIFRLFR